MKSTRYAAAALLLVMLGCERSHHLERPEKILARVGGKTISVNEFIRRAEYTPRPPYCGGDSYPHKKIVLNSLIAEKLFALEAGDDNLMISSPPVAAWLQGRKEQTMREYLYLDKGYNGVVIDTTVLKGTVVNAAQRYQVAYFNVLDSTQAMAINRRLRVEREPMLPAMQSFAPLDTLPQREVVWSKSESDAMLDSLFLTRRQPGDLIGPIKTAPGQYTFMQVLAKRGEVVVTDEQLKTLWDEVKERLTDRKARQNWDGYVLGLMRGKKIEFNRATFFKLADLLGPVYLRRLEEERAAIEQSIWDRPEKDINWDSYRSQVQAMAGEPLFQIDGRTWTVETFFRELAVHPLVFRDKRIKNREFGKQLQLAIMDMIRDHYLTREAYKQRLDRLAAVEREAGMWRDNLNYLFYRDGVLKALGDSVANDPHYIKVIERHLNGKVEELQQKYSAQVEIDLAEFEKIKLTRLSMSVGQENVPYAKVVPSFPQVTTSFRLDYGRKMEPGKNP